MTSCTSWKLVSIQASDLNLPWFEQESHSNICIVKGYGDAFEVAVEKSYLSELELQGLQVNDPTKPSQTEENLYGIRHAIIRAQRRWVQHAVDVIYSKHSSEVKEAYRDHAYVSGLQREVDRQSLIYKISESSADVRQQLGRNFIFLVLNFEPNQTSQEVQILLQTDLNGLLTRLEFMLQICKPPRRPMLYEPQITFLFQALLELSGGALNLPRRNFTEEYTVAENSDLIASVFGITRTHDFGLFDKVKMCETLSKSPMFLGTTINNQDLENWVTKMKDFLHIGFCHNYLDLPSQVLYGFGVGHIYMIRTYLTKTYIEIPALQKPSNNVLLLLLFHASMPYRDEQICGRQTKILKEWASSGDGQKLYLRLAAEFQDHQALEQLTLTMAAKMIYRRLLPDFSDDFDHPVTSSYLSDLDALSRGRLLGNSGRVAERMVFASIRVLRSCPTNLDHLTKMLETALERNPPPLHAFDGLSDNYLRLRMEGCLHETAMTDTLKLPKLLVHRIPELSMVDSGVISVASPKTSIDPPSAFFPDDYTLL